jgi:dipeptidyl-peptidase-4
MMGLFHFSCFPPMFVSTHIPEYMNRLHKSFLQAACLLVITSPAVAQKAFYTMAEAVNGMTTTLAPKSVKQGAWINDMPMFTEVLKTDNDEYLVAHNYKTGLTDTILTKSTCAICDSFKAIPKFTWLDGQIAYTSQENKVYFYKLEGNKLKPSFTRTLLGSADSMIVQGNNGNWVIAYPYRNNLVINSNKGIEENTAITSEPNINIISGRTVHREEFGIDKGIFWSPKGNLLAYYRMDQTIVADYPIINWAVTPAVVTNVKYPMAGGVSHHVTVHVYNPANAQTVELKTGVPADQYLTCVTWSPDEKSVFIAVLSRDQSHLWLNQYDATTGEKIKTLFEETDAKYVHPTHELSFLPGSSDQFIWQSERDGYNHLYLYNTSGKLIRQVTKGDWVVNELICFNQKRNEVIYTSSQESPLEKHCYAANWTNGKMRRIDAEQGMHTIAASTDGEYLFDVVNGPDIPKRSMIRGVDGNLVKVLVDSPDPLAGYQRPSIKNIVLKADDGTPLYGKIILPYDFDETKKYPVIVYLYNGPNVQLVHNQFPESGNLWYEYMAQHGYVVFTMDGRGSSNRGTKFEQATFRQLGTVELDDQMKGVAYLKSLKFVDPARMGIHGWSYGGFMTTSMMLRNPGVFKCAVAGGPVMDWKMYEIMYTERYMDTPQDNPEGYKNANLLTKVKNLKGNLMLIHGTQDPVVVWQQSINFLKKSVDEGVQVDYFVYPGYEHNVRGKDRVHLMQKVTNYFDLYLKP